MFGRVKQFSNKGKINPLPPIPCLNIAIICVCLLPVLRVLFQQGFYTPLPLSADKREKLAAVLFFLIIASPPARIKRGGVAVKSLLSLLIL